MNIEYISYTGEYPCLCLGVLTLRINGKNVEISNPLKSSGSCGFEDGEPYIEKDEWKLREERLPEGLLPYSEQILEVVNKNIPHGCCGGCI